MKKILIIILVIILGLISLYLYNNHIIKNSYNQNNGDYVVLLHGLGRTSLSMQKIGVKLAKNGYKVININYPSRSDSIENLVNNNLKKELLEKCTDESKKINFVSHSMGGIMVRYLLTNDNTLNVGKIVMLVPPNQGSELANKWSNTKNADLHSSPFPILKNMDPDAGYSRHDRYRRKHPGHWEIHCRESVRSGGKMGALCLQQSVHGQI